VIGERMTRKAAHTRRAAPVLLVPGLLFLALTPAHGAGPKGKQAVEPEPLSHADAIRAIAKDIAALKGTHPQLVDFDVEKHCHPDRLVIDYDYHTHPPRHRGGWTAGVPNPDPDGVWFYIDFHDPDSMAQIHTQPVVPERRRGDKRVMFLMLQGEKTKSLSGPIEEILARHGVTGPPAQQKR